VRALAERGPLPAQLAGEGRGRYALRATTTLLAAALLVTTLMRPQCGTAVTRIKNLGIDIAIAVDASKSMMVQDVVPDRLTAAKLEIRRLLDRLAGGRVALVPFAGLAFVQTPLTSDFEVIKTYLDDLRVEDMPRGGTALGRALVEAIRVLVPPEQLEGTVAEVTAPEEGAAAAPSAAAEADLPEHEGAKHKAILLFTDGDDHEGDPLEVAKIAKKLGIRIFTVGVGTAQGRPVPIVNEDGEVVGTMKGDDGRTPLFSELNAELLRGVGQATGGELFQLGPTGLEAGLLAAIDQLEKKEYDATFQELGADQYQWTLVPAILLLAIEALLGSRRRRRRRPGAAQQGVA
jgi:Ca-activated chloride channel family protein